MLAVEIIAHRGASYDAPENTLSSFKLGYQNQADANELDIYLTADGRAVVIHDANTFRVSGISNAVSKCSFEQLRQLEIGQFGQWKDKGFAEKIPALDEVLPLVPESKRLLIEIKCGPEILPELGRVLEGGGKKPAQTAIIGFDHETMRQAKAKFPGLQVYWLVTSAKKNHRFPPVEEMIQKAQDAKLDGLNINSDFPIDSEFVANVHAAGLKLYTWTVDDPEVARKEAAAGVDGITTNRAGWMREQLSVK